MMLYDHMSNITLQSFHARKASIALLNAFGIVVLAPVFPLPMPKRIAAFIAIQIDTLIVLQAR